MSSYISSNFRLSRYFRQSETGIGVSTVSVSAGASNIRAPVGNGVVVVVQPFNRLSQSNGYVTALPQETGHLDEFSRFVIAKADVEHNRIQEMSELSGELMFCFNFLKCKFLILLFFRLVTCCSMFRIINEWNCQTRIT